MLLKILNGIRKNFLDFIFIYFLIIGSVLILIHYLIMHYEISHLGLPICKDFGMAILSGGVLASILKSKQFTEIFSSEIESIIYSDKFLKKKNDINHIWEKVTQELCQQKFQSINNDLFKGIKDFYLPIEHQYYYKDYKVSISISMDQDDKDYIVITENIETKIVAETDKQIDFRFSNTIITEKSDFAKTNHKINYIKINGESQKFDINKIQKREDGFKLMTKYETKLSGSNEYKIEREEVKKINYKLNPNRIHNAIWLYNNISIEVDFPANLFVTFQKMGVNKEWDKKFTSNNYYTKLKSEYKGIVFPNQGFLLNYRLK